MNILIIAVCAVLCILLGIVIGMGIERSKYLDTTPEKTEEEQLEGYAPVDDTREQMNLLKINFPEVYELYTKGIVILTSIYKYTQEGVSKVGIKYHYR